MSSNTRSKVITHYDGRAGTTREQRISSKILALRKFQNWVKATLINTYAEKGAAVLDLACGKGGDLMKWSKVEISKYYGCGWLRVELLSA